MVCLRTKYVGENKAVDSAATAVILAWRSRLQKAPPADGMRHYVQAIQELRSSLDPSDLSLLSVALMTNFESVTRNTAIPMYPHIQGLAAITRARPKGFQTSEVARAVLYTFCDELFRLACHTGMSHALDNPRHRNLEPPSRTTSRDESVLSLRRTAYRIFVGLPRLIFNFRAWQERIEQGEMVHVPDSVFLLARELLDIRNEGAETQLLHRVSLVRTEDLNTRKLMSYSFEFGSFPEMEAIGLYWEARLLTVSICLRIRTLEEVIQFGSERPHQTQTQPSTEFSKAKDEKQSCLANMIMAWQYTLRTPILPKDTMQALFVIVRMLMNRSGSPFHQLPLACRHLLTVLPFCFSGAQWPTSRYSAITRPLLFGTGFSSEPA